MIHLYKNAQLHVYSEISDIRPVVSFHTAQGSRFMSLAGRNHLCPRTLNTNFSIYVEDPRKVLWELQEGRVTVLVSVSLCSADKCTFIDVTCVSLIVSWAFYL